MNGTRYGDFTRGPQDPGSRYTAVLEQQGRVQLDADWNDQVAIVQHALRVALGDVLGSSWAPAGAPGFGLRPKVALRFDGSERLVLDESGALAPGAEDQHTLELWLTWSGGAAVLVDCRNADGSQGYELAIEETGTVVLALSVQEGGGTTLRLYSAGPLPSGKPFHLALIVAQDSVALLVDGRQVAHGRHSGVSTFDQPRIVFGGPSGDPSASRGFRGTAAAIRVWRTARTLAQLAEAAVSALTADLVATTEPGLLAVWTFDYSAGSPLDDAATGRTATIATGGAATWRLVDLTIEPGRLYLEGVLCELATPTSYVAQPGITDGALPEDGEYLAYLEVWEESVSAAEDSALREVALGGLDTSVRARIASRVRLEQIDDDASSAALTPPAQAATGKLVAQHTGHVAPGNHLYRVEIHASGQPGGTSPATFKWSRDNGASVFAVKPSTPAGVVQLLYASAAVTPLAPNDIVEALPAGAPLDAPAHPLLRVVGVSAADGTVTLEDAPPAGTALLRRWDNRPRGGDGKKPSALTGAELPVGSEWVTLEDGIRARFEGEEFRRGDYWWIVARMDTGTIAWPQQAGHATARAPDGVERLRAPLARLSLRDGGIEIEDLRRIVNPIPQPRAETVVWDTQTETSAPSSDEESDAERREEDAEDLAVEVGLELLDAIVEEEDEEDPTEEGDLTGEVVLEWDEWADLEQQEADEVDPEPAAQTPPREPEPREPEPREREPEPREPERERERAPAGWSRVGDLELAGAHLRSAASVAGSIVLLTDRGLLSLSVPNSEVTELGSLPGKRDGAQLLAVEQRLLLIGGGPEEGHPDGRVFHFDLAAGEWVEGAPMPVKHSHVAAAAARGRVHVIGGRSRAVRQRVHGAHHIYDPARDRWSEALELPTPRAGAAAATLGDRLHVVGSNGGTRDTTVHVVHEVFDLDNGTWHTETPLPEARPVVSSGAHRGRHVIGLHGSDHHLGDRGATHHAGEQLVAFDPASQTWEQLPPVPAGLRGAKLVSHGDRLLAFGTREGRAVEIHELS